LLLQTGLPHVWVTVRGASCLPRRGVRRVAHGQRVIFRREQKVFQWI
jgi:hypothetical protein